MERYLKQCSLYSHSLALLGLLTLTLAGCNSEGNGGDDGGADTQTHEITATAGDNGGITPASITVDDGATTDFTLTPDSGYGIASVTGCDGSLSGNTYTTGEITAACTVEASFELMPPPAPTLSLSPAAVKTFQFSWGDLEGETEYKLLEDPTGISGYTEVASIDADATEHELVVSLPKRINARYILQACNSVGCSDSDAVYVSGTLVEAVGYVKSSNTGAGDRFGWSVALSNDGTTLAVGAYGENSSTTGEGSVPNDDASSAGAVYVFIHSDSLWGQQAYIKASNAGSGDEFGRSVALSGDGDTLAVGAPREDSTTTGVGGTHDDDANGAGAAYLY